jgi:hypothetical protein
MDKRLMASLLGSLETPNLLSPLVPPADAPSLLSGSSTAAFRSRALLGLLGASLPPAAGSGAPTILEASPPPAVGFGSRSLFGLLGASPPRAAGFAAPTILDDASPFGAHSSLFGTWTPPVKRKAFFSFHYDDVVRACVVRNAWKIPHPASTVSFSDSSMWESKKLEGDAALKGLIREGVSNTSVVCVLVGSQTWDRRWTRYEIARAVIDERGLLAVHLNSIKHHVTRTPHSRGANPLEFMAVAKEQQNAFAPAKYYLYEQNLRSSLLGGWERVWERYRDHTDPVKLPPWLRDPTPGYLMPLSANAAEYDYMADDGHKNIGLWIDRAAQQVGR